MSDDELINQIATIWVDAGGNITGFCYCQGRIIDAIDRKIKEK